MIPKWLPPGPQFWAVFTGGAFLLAGTAILSGVKTVLACRLLTAMFVGRGFGVGSFSICAASGPRRLGGQRDLAAIGSAWVMADFIRNRHEERFQR